MSFDRDKLYIFSLILFSSFSILHDLQLVHNAASPLAFVKKETMSAPFVVLRIKKNHD